MQEAGNLFSVASIMEVATFERKVFIDGTAPVNQRNWLLSVAYMFELWNVIVRSFKNFGVSKWKICKRLQVKMLKNYSSAPSMKFASSRKHVHRVIDHSLDATTIWSFTTLLLMDYHDVVHSCKIHVRLLRNFHLLSVNISPRLTNV